MPFQSVGGTLVQLSRKLFLIDGDKRALLRCIIQQENKNVLCTWLEYQKQKEDRKYQVALIAPRSILNCTANNVKNNGDHQMFLDEHVLQ